MIVKCSRCGETFVIDKGERIHGTFGYIMCLPCANWKLTEYYSKLYKDKRFLFTKYNLDKSIRECRKGYKYIKKEQEYDI